MLMEEGFEVDGSPGRVEMVWRLWPGSLGSLSDLNSNMS
jgi:hypothetical protein